MQDSLLQIKERSWLLFLAIVFVICALRTPTPLPQFPADTIRPQFAGSELVDTLLKKALLMAGANGKAVVEAPTGVDLGALVPQGILGDGTEVWGPAEDSPLAGTFKVRVRNGQVVSQEILNSRFVD